MDYNYYCENNCKIGDYAKCKADGYELVVSKKYKKLATEPLVWTVSHPMKDKPEVRCPVCSGPAEKYLGLMNINFHVRGNWALDKAGCRREMDLHKLANPKDNLYDEHYEPGERDDIRSRLIKAGRDAMRAKTAAITQEIMVRRKMSKKKATTICLR